MPSELLEAQLLQLPLDERAHLARLLIESLDEQPALDPQWLAEASRRAAELREGRMTAVPAPEVFDAARRSLAG
jgi:putative addiction module component (TIGR02574 family)